MRTEEEYCVNMSNNEEWFNNYVLMKSYVKDNIEDVDSVVHYKCHFDNNGELIGDISDHTEILFDKKRKINKIGL